MEINEKQSKNQSQTSNLSEFCPCASSDGGIFTTFHPKQAF
jgi:hypothetical protein